MDTDCVFCKIAAREIPAQIVFEDDDIIAIKDIQPIAPGHTVVFSTNHYRHTREMPPEEQGLLFRKAVEVAEKAVRETGAEGYNLLICEGEAAQSTVPHRPHIHVIPRKTGDGLHIDPRS